MPRGTRYITIEGQYASGVLGTFNIIRGFAPLQDLARISAPFQMVPAADAEGHVHGHQREIDQAHAESIKRYLQEGNLRFLPEVILAIRTEYRDELDEQRGVIGVISDSTPGLRIRRRWKSRNIATHQIRVELRHLDQLVADQKCIRRVDGNHRLHLADQLELDERMPTKYLAPFCAILLAPPGDDNDDFTESMLFHVINSTAMPLDSEHALQLVLGQHQQFQTADDEFATSPALHLTRVLKEKLDAMPQAQRDRIGPRPATVLYEAAKAMVAATPELSTERQSQTAFADGFCGALTDVLARLREAHQEFCSADYFIELAALVWNETTGDAAPENRITAMVATLDALGQWLGRDGLHRIQAQQSIARQILEIYNTVRKRVPKRVFLARWYPTDQEGSEKTKADLRLQMIKTALDELRVDGIDLALDDPGTKAGGTFPIHQEMYRAIAEDDIILIDLSGVRPNVCVETGYALERHSADRLLFLFQPTKRVGKNPKFAEPPFDLQTFRYERIGDAAEIPQKLKPHLEAIWRAARQGR